MSRCKGSENTVQCVPDDTRGLLEPFKCHRWGWKVGSANDICSRCGFWRNHRKGKVRE